MKLPPMVAVNIACFVGIVAFFVIASIAAVVRDGISFNFPF